MKVKSCKFDSIQNVNFCVSVKMISTYYCVSAIVIFLEKLQSICFLSFLTRRVAHSRLRLTIKNSRIGVIIDRVQYFCSIVLLSKTNCKHMFIKDLFNNVLCGRLWLLEFKRNTSQSRLIFFKILIFFSKITKFFEISLNHFIN